MRRHDPLVVQARGDIRRRILTSAAAERPCSHGARLFRFVAQCPEHVVVGALVDADGANAVQRRRPDFRSRIPAPLDEQVECAGGADVAQKLGDDRGFSGVRFRVFQQRGARRLTRSAPAPAPGERAGDATGPKAATPERESRMDRQSVPAPQRLPPALRRRGHPERRSTPGVSRHVSRGQAARTASALTHQRRSRSWRFHRSTRPSATAISAPRRVTAPSATLSGSRISSARTWRWCQGAASSRATLTTLSSSCRAASTMTR